MSLEQFQNNIEDTPGYLQEKLKCRTLTLKISSDLEGLEALIAGGKGILNRIATLKKFGQLHNQHIDSPHCLAFVFLGIYQKRWNLAYTAKPPKK